MTLDIQKRFGVLPPGAFRLALAFLVLVSHASRFNVGRLAVLLFFYLSGYWVSRIYAGEFGGRKWLTFYVSRWLRIAPLYLLVVIPAAIALRLPIDLENLTIFGVATTGHDPTGVSWSLDMELQFYLLMPLFFLLLSRRALLLALAGVLCLFGWWLKVRFGVMTVFMYLPVFTLGAINDVTRWNPGRKAAFCSLAGFGLVTAGLAVIPATRVFLSKLYNPPFDEDIFSMVWMLPLVPYIAASLAQRSSAHDRDVGNWSYPLYLIQYPLIASFVQHGHSKWVGVLLALPLALALYYGPDRLFERVRRALISSATRRIKPIPAET